MGKPVRLVKTMNAVGDCLLARPFVRELAYKYDLSVETPFAQLFGDLPIKRFVRGRTNVSYVTKAVKEFGEHGLWRGAPKDADGNAIGSVRIAYGLEDPRPLTKQMEDLVPLTLARYEFDLPPDELSPPYDPQPYAVVRPNVWRPEFPMTARAPLDGYLREAVRLLRRQGFKTVSFANAPHEEVSELDVDVRYDKGELTFKEMMNMIRYARAVVTPPGFAGLMSVAAQRHTAVIWGARGALDNPTRVFDERMGLSRLKNFSPDVACPHSTSECGCDKRIDWFNANFKDFAERAYAEA